VTGRLCRTATTLRDGWIHTGDIGRLDGDGYLYVVDRKKDMLIYKGYNVYPRELEDILRSHRAVEQCAVIGKEDPLKDLEASRSGGGEGGSGDAPAGGSPANG